MVEVRKSPLLAKRCMDLNIQGGANRAPNGGVSAPNGGPVNVGTIIWTIDPEDGQTRAKCRKYPYPGFEQKNDGTPVRWCSKCTGFGP